VASFLCKEINSCKKKKKNAILMLKNRKEN